MSKIEYAKFQFMILVLQALGCLILRVVLDNPPVTKDDKGNITELALKNIPAHIAFIATLMEEK